MVPVAGAGDIRHGLRDVADPPRSGHDQHGALVVLDAQLPPRRGSSHRRLPEAVTHERTTRPRFSPASLHGRHRRPGADREMEIHARMHPQRMDREVGHERRDRNAQPAPLAHVAEHERCEWVHRHHRIRTSSPERALEAAPGQQAHRERPEEDDAIKRVAHPTVGAVGDQRVRAPGEMALTVTP